MITVLYLLPGILNVHIWEGWCGSRIEDLKRNMHFPLFPSVFTNISRFFAQWHETGYGERIFGYLHPPLTGNYTFAVSCDDNCEVWLSNSTDIFSTQKIVYVGTKEEPANTDVGDFKRFSTQISQEIFLEAGKKYFIEALHKQAAFKDHFLLAWLAPGWIRVKTITSADISSYMSLENITDINDIADYIPETMVSHHFSMNNSMESIYTLNKSVHKFGRADDRDKFHLVPLVNLTDFEGLLPQIDYQPSYLVDFVPERYEGVHLVHETAVYPNDNTELTHMVPYHDCFYHHTNSYMSRLNTKKFEHKFVPIFSKVIQSVNNLSNSLHPFPKKLFNKVENINTTKKQDIINELNTVTKNVFGRKLLHIFTTISTLKNTSVDSNLHVSKDILPTKPVVIESNKNKSEIWNGTWSRMEQYNFSKSFESSKFSYLKPVTRSPLNYRHPRFDDRIHKKIDQKVFFKNGRSDNFSFVSTLEMIRMYDIFGPAVHYLRRIVERGLKYIYSSVHSTCKSDGNLVLSTEIALSIVNRYMKIVKNKYNKKYSLKKVINIEENHDVVKGNRYLVELDLYVDGKENSFRFSRYVYQDISGGLYEPHNFQWNVDASIHVIVPVKDQGRWLLHFIRNMENIYLETNDSRINVIIVDFNSTDMDIEKCLHLSQIPRYQVVKLNGPFQRALGIQAGANLVKQVDDIIFTCDLHLDIPSHLFDSIRKHTIKGKMAFAPMVHRLSCGYTPDLPYGLWENEGYGLFSITKNDFDRVGGMNTREFKTKWGGEDWELLDRVLAHGLEVERFRISKFYHYHHSKKRMWTAHKTSNVPLFPVIRSIL
ncbi:beta-1,4-N-acetylgalactosaminyltransferase 3 isoform X2 [Hydra vulgaris]|uniref:beta-1,4-N-acetylgalactosaminyltransferase 3 isoform X2 n=1 Tax=Hydra vulgaris TaxID=6087 RepID=UPI001F5EB899|nr:beta-1,4-N-acetylgalactosaminyltransferase 3 isoform X2 [Hydra vulgaris]